MFSEEWKTEKVYEIIIPQVHGKVLLDGGELFYRAGDAVIVPPCVRYCFTPEGRHLGGRGRQISEKAFAR